MVSTPNIMGGAPSGVITVENMKISRNLTLTSWHL